MKKVLLINVSASVLNSKSRRLTAFCEQEWMAKSHDPVIIYRRIRDLEVE